MSVRLHIHWLANFLTRATPLLIIAAATFFAYQNAGFQKDNRELLKNTKATTESTNVIARDTKQIIDNLEAAVIDLKADNEQQTLILCRMIVRSNLSFEFEPNEEAEIESICQAEIDRQAAQNRLQSLAPQSQPVAQGHPQTNLSNSRGLESDNAPMPTPETMEPPAQLGVLDRVSDGLTNLLSPVLELLINRGGM